MSQRKSSIQRIQEANKLRSKLLNAENVADKIKLHEAVINMFQNNATANDGFAKENEALGDQRTNKINGNGDFSRLDPPVPENGDSELVSYENLDQQTHGVSRRHSVSSNSSTSSRIPKLSKAKYGKITHIPASSGEQHLPPDAEKRVFNYNYRGPIPTQPHCQKSLFGKTVDVEPVETPKKKRSLSQSRPTLRSQAVERPITWSLPKENTHARLASNESSKINVRKESKSDHNLNKTPWNGPEPHEKKTQTNKLNESLSNASNVQPLKLPNASSAVEHVTSSSPFKHVVEDSKNYVLPKISVSDERPNSPVTKETTPSNHYKTPSTFMNDRGSTDDEDSFESAKEMQTPQRKPFNRSIATRTPVGKSSVISTSDFHNDSAAEIAKIDAVLSSVSPPYRKSKQTIPSRTINLTPRTDYSQLPNESFEEVLSRHSTTPLKEMNAKEVDEDDSNKSMMESQTPLASKSAVSVELIPETKLTTSVTRDELLRNFKLTLDLQLIAKKQYARHAKQCLKNNGSSMEKIEMIDQQLDKLKTVQQEAIQKAEENTLDYTDAASRALLYEMRMIQDSTRLYFERSKEKKLRASLSRLATVVPWKDRSHQESSPLHVPCSSSSKSLTAETPKEYNLHDDVNLANIPPPVFDISDGSDRFSLGIKEQENLLNWNSGLSEDLLPSNDVAGLEAETSPLPCDTSFSSLFDESPLEKDVNEIRNYIKQFCENIWPEVQGCYTTGTYQSLSEFAYNGDDSDQHFHECSVRKLVSDTVILETQKDLRKGIVYPSFEKYVGKITDVCIKKLSLGRNNDILDRRYIWTQRDPSFSYIVPAAQDEETTLKEVVKEAMEYKKMLVCKALQYEIVLNSNVQTMRLPGVAYDEVVKFLKKHASVELDAVLSQFSDGDETI